MLLRSNYLNSSATLFYNINIEVIILVRFHLFRHIDSRHNYLNASIIYDTILTFSKSDDVHSVILWKAWNNINCEKYSCINIKWTTENSLDKWTSYREKCFAFVNKDAKEMMDSLEFRGNITGKIRMNILINMEICIPREQWNN